MMRKKGKIYYNLMWALIYQCTTLVCNFIIPQLLISSYGSSVNGLIHSISHFLSFITLCECGVGAVVQSALYKPLAENNNDEISKVVISSKRFFNIIIAILSVYVLILMAVYPNIVHDFDFKFTASLILIQSIQYFAQHYLFMTYRILLNADQLSFIHLSVHSGVLVLNALFTVVLVKIECPIHVLKLASVLIYSIQPFALKAYVKRHYNLNLKIKLTEEPIKQKWNGFAQHIASVVLTNTDVVVLTLFSSLENVSVYNVYHLVAHGLRQVFLSAMMGVQPLLGNLYAKQEGNNLQKTFDRIETYLHFAVSLIYSVAGVLIIPFVRVYTRKFNDTNYLIPEFGIVLLAAYGMYTIQALYDMMIKSAGHYKQTQKSALIEASINVVLSLLFVFRYGLVGVAIGTLNAMLYRTFYYVFYLRKNILCRNISVFFKHFFVDLLSVIAVCVVTRPIQFEVKTYMGLVSLAAPVFVIAFMVTGLINIIFFERTVFYSFHKNSW